MDNAAAWVTSSCRDVGLVVTSPAQLAQDRPWSRVAVYDVRHGIDLARAWSLTRDAGPTWRSAIAVSDHWPLWEHLLQRYAAAQLAIATDRTTLQATGIPERSPVTLPGQAAELVAELTLLGADGVDGVHGVHGVHGEDEDEQGDDSGGLSVADSHALTARLPAYGQCCRELDAAGIPWTIQHDDLHSNNICRAEPAGDRVTGPSAGSRIIDWGDASIGHPFGTMLSTLRSIAHHGGCEVDDPRVDRVRDAYLEPFTTYATHSELIALVDVARRVSALTRALSWRAALIESPASVHRDYEFPVRGWLRELMAEPPPS
jgi:hypothetical protein